MRYEHTTIAVFALIFGIFLMIEFFLVNFAGAQWLLGYPTVYGSLFYIVFVRWGFILGPVFIGLGIIGIKREIEVRDIDHQARYSLHSPRHLHQRY